MKVEIWSDVMCPFCYIGKRHFEQALQQFPNKDEVEVVWHSFQLDPSVQYTPGKGIHDFLADRKGISKDRAKQMNDQVTQMAARAGLKYDFDKAIPANTFDAHRLIQLAKDYNLQDEVEERLFAAYFTEGKNIGDHATLIALGEEIGLDATIIKDMLTGNGYSADVDKDINEAQALGIRGVPFFVIDRKYGVSGAQPHEVFINALQTAWQEAQKEKIIIQPTAAEGAICTPGEGCTPANMD